jgi:predicted MPP superfamily phosphohydrolase
MDWGMTHWRALLGVVLVGALLGGAVYARKIEPEDVEVVSISLALPRLDGRFDGYRIAQISDLHADDWMTPGRVSRLVDLINAEEPDLVLITGDFASYSPLSSKIRHVPDLVAPLKRLHAPDGSFAVLGNHDHKTNAQVVRRVLAASGVIELCNTVRTLRRGGVALHLCGVDSALEGVSRLERVLERLPKRGATILLAHEPDVADEVAATGRFDLQLSGHSHGGQLGLPLLRFPFLPKLSRRYPVGLYRVSEMFLYTNRGLGAHPRFRFACRPEVTIFTLLA